MNFKCGSLRAPLSVILIALVAACGGGGGGGESTNAADSSALPSAPPPVSFNVGSLVGSWASCTPISASHSVLAEYVFTRASDSSLSVRLNSYDYQSALCNASLSSSGGDLQPSIYTFDGTKMVDAELVQKITVTAPNGFTTKQIFVLRQDGSLHFGTRFGAGNDEDGYPTAISVAGYTKE
ncbi:MAG: hypothetical protein JWQ76_2920 [Ramlibacter sp.]|nr:hypothetical protein [Ramlibacter sp.]